MTRAQAEAGGDRETLRHYGAGRIDRVLQALDDAGQGGERVGWDVFAPLDQFHVGGLAATRAFAERLGLRPETRVLDLGCGLGGPARCLAATYGCKVVGIDLSSAFIEIGAELTRRAGLSDRVQHIQGDATALPFEASSFDLIWTQHVAMNIADRDRLYAGVARALTPGGRLAAYDVVEGEKGLPYLPAPWARDVAQSFVVTPETMRAAIERSGLAIADWRDVTSGGIDFFKSQSRSATAAAPSLSLALVMGPDFPVLAGNLARSLAEGRACLVQVIAQKPL